MFVLFLVHYLIKCTGSTRTCCLKKTYWFTRNDCLTRWLVNATGLLIGRCTDWSRQFISNPDSVILTCTWRISTIFFFIWTRVLNHNKYVEIKQFSKVDIKQNNISAIILLIKFLVYQWNPRHLQGSRVVNIFVYMMKFVFYLISIYIFVCINHRYVLIW